MPIPDDIRQRLAERIARAVHPREMVLEVLFELQVHYGWLPDKAVHEAAALCSMSPLEVEELATFYTFTYREPVGRYVIHLCDSTVCWMDGSDSLRAHLCEKLGVRMGETTQDGLFTLLPVCCIGYCDRSPAMLINGKVYGPLTVDKVDEILETLKKNA